jgi:hypothetical protein
MSDWLPADVKADNALKSDMFARTIGVLNRQSLSNFAHGCASPQTDPGRNRTVSEGVLG